MKHLFYIHSYITYFVSLEVIKYKQFNPADCVFMYGRGFSPEDAGSVALEVNIPYEHHPKSSFLIERQFWKSWRKLRSFDAFLGKLTSGTGFHLYTNQTGIDFIRLFMSHRNCQGFSFIEEGLYSYYSFKFINHTLCPPIGKPNLNYKLLTWLNFGGRLKQQRYFLAPDYSAVYGIHADVFPEFRNRNIMPFPFGSVNDVGETGKAVLILDSFMEYGVVTWGAFEKALTKAFDHFHNQNVKELLIRFHPKQYENSVLLQQLKELITTRQKDIAVVEIAQKESMELLAGNPSYKELRFYVFLSSAALYAALCGRKAYSFAPFLAEEDALYRQRVSEVPKIFRDMVHFIKKP